MLIFSKRVRRLRAGSDGIGSGPEDAEARAQVPPPEQGPRKPGNDVMSGVNREGGPQLVCEVGRVSTRAMTP